MFSAVAKVTGAAGLIVLLFAKPLKRLMGSENPPAEILPVGAEAATREGA